MLAPVELGGVVVADIGESGRLEAGGCCGVLTAASREGEGGGHETAGEHRDGDDRSAVL